jgi:hypothetical protein
MVGKFILNYKFRRLQQGSTEVDVCEKLFSATRQFTNHIHKELLIKHSPLFLYSYSYRIIDFAELTCMSISSCLAIVTSEIKICKMHEPVYVHIRVQ